MAPGYDKKNRLLQVGPVGVEEVRRLQAGTKSISVALGRREIGDSRGMKFGGCRPIIRRIACFAL